jgi:hypothetical protein
MKNNYKMESFEEVLNEIYNLQKRGEWKGGQIEWEKNDRKGSFGAGLLLFLSEIPIGRELDLNDLIKTLDTYGKYLESSYSEDRLRLIIWTGELERANLLEKRNSNYIRQNTKEYSFKMIPHNLPF